MAWMRYRMGGAALAVTLLAGAGSAAAVAGARPAQAESPCGSVIEAILAFEHQELEAALMYHEDMVSVLNVEVMSQLDASMGACFDKGIDTRRDLRSARLSFDWVPAALAMHDWRAVRRHVHTGIVLTEDAEAAAY